MVPFDKRLLLCSYRVVKFSKLTEGGVELLENKGNKAITVLAECHIILGIGSTFQLKVSEGEQQLK